MGVAADREGPCPARSTCTPLIYVLTARLRPGLWIGLPHEVISDRAISPELGIIWLPGARGRMPLAQGRRSRRAENRSWSPQRLGRDAIKQPAGRASGSRSGIPIAPCHP